jgi:dolichyl-phosphate beta-glucosyltransferase
MAPALSFIIPAYNEASRIGPTLETVREYLGAQPYVSETLVVDDGSHDATGRVVAGFIPLFQERGLTLRVLSNDGNRGKGYSVRHGFLEARGDIALFSDADLSTPLFETPRLIQPIIEDQCDVAFGSRDLPDSRIGVRQSRFREAAGRTFNVLMRIMTGLRISDTQCGFKAFRRHSLRPIFERQRVKGFAFDVEVLYLAQKYGFRLREIPVAWNHVEGSKVGINAGSFRAFADVAAIRWRDWRGRYDGLSVEMKKPALQASRK